MELLEVLDSGSDLIVAKGDLPICPEYPLHTHPIRLQGEFTAFSSAVTATRSSPLPASAAESSSFRPIAPNPLDDDLIVPTEDAP